MNERERLLLMLRENKISEEEYQLLSASFKKDRSQLGQFFMLLMNPFQRIAGVQALIGGILVLVSMAYVGVKAKLYFPGLLSALNANVVKNATIQPDFYFLMYQILVGWGVITALFVLCTRLFKQKGTRIIDFVGTTALARFPSLLMTLFLLGVRVVNPSIMEIDLSKGLPMHTPFMVAMFFELPIIALLMWQITMYFYALKESSGLVGKNLWISFVIAMVLGEVIANSLTTLGF